MVQIIFFRKKYFSPQEIYFSPQKKYYFSARNIFLRKKYIFPQEIYFFPQEIFFSARNIFFSARNIFFPQEIIFSPREIYFFRKKYVFPTHGHVGLDWCSWCSGTRACKTSLLSVTIQVVCVPAFHKFMTEKPKYCKLGDRLGQLWDGWGTLAYIRIINNTEQINAAQQA